MKSIKHTKIITVTMTDKITRTIVNSKYFPINGVTNEVGGIISTIKN